MSEPDLIQTSIELQRKYRQGRRLYAWRLSKAGIGRAYSEDTDKPEPGVLDLAVEDEG